jgi:uncharacterized protein YjbI with pentapeptide repeats
VLHFPTAEKDLAEFEEAIKGKAKNKDFDFRGVYFPGISFSGATFDRDADFRGATFSEESSFSHTTFDNYADFRGAIFSGTAHFTRATFSGTANFSEGATFTQWAGFSGATFNEAEFWGATFGQRVVFSHATFNEMALFSRATFSEESSFSKATFTRKAYFSEATFSGKADFSEVSFSAEPAFSAGADFSGATFSEEADFSGATFSEEADFRRATFKERAAFYSLQTKSRTAFMFGDATIEKPERFSFRSTPLRASWFVDVAAQKFDFSDVEWFRSPTGDELTLQDEIKTLERQGYHPPESLHKLTKACSMLMNNAEENRDYPTANEFHYWSMEAVREEGWSRLGIIASLYWALSGYGERPRRAFWVLVTIWLAFAAFYFLLVGSSPFLVFSASDIGAVIKYAGQALAYSLSALVRLNPRSPSEELDWFYTLATIEGILGPLQIGLLFLAIRRQVMR